MNGTTLSFKNFMIAAICCILVPLFGYLYVSSFNMGIRIILVVHGLVLFFLFFALSLTDLKSSLVFTMILVIPMAIDFSLLRYPAPPGYPPFSESIVVNLVDLILAVLMIQWVGAASIKKTHGTPTIGAPIGTLFSDLDFLQSSGRLAQGREPYLCLFRSSRIVSGIFGLFLPHKQYEYCARCAGYHLCALCRAGP